MLGNYRVSKQLGISRVVVSSIELVIYSTLKIDVIGFSELSADLQQTTRRYIREYSTHHSYRCENFKCTTIH
jgi:hypothetical protein